MPRSPKFKHVLNHPEITYFKPRGVPLRDLAEVYLSLEGFEALRLADLEGLKHVDAAQQMKVSRQTFGRILAAARKTMAEAIILGHALRIEGGNYVLQDKNDESVSGTVGFSSDSERTEGLRVSPSEKRKGSHPIEESKMSKIAISSEGPTLDEKVDPRFGRAGGFIIIDPETMDFEYKGNGASQAAARGAGIQTAELVSGTGANVVLTGYVGPKAFDALTAAGIKVGQDCEGLTVREAIERFNNGSIKIADKPNR
ncbi:MAG: DUF134 domain-containing protein [Deltaproteobacteria bacterium]|nr:DUF134 domain-containing protein [Deltaproteobacteria bacterium]